MPSRQSGFHLAAKGLDSKEKPSLYIVGLRTAGNVELQIRQGVQGTVVALTFDGEFSFNAA